MNDNLYQHQRDAFKEAERRAMQPHIDPVWLRNMADKEANGIVSVGGFFYHATKEVPPADRITSENIADMCQWNPEDKRPAIIGDIVHAEGTLVVGKVMPYRLCQDCAELKRFNGQRRRSLKP